MIGRCLVATWVSCILGAQLEAAIVLTDDNLVYTQNFDTLTTVTNTTQDWIDNNGGEPDGPTGLLGWYAAYGTGAAVTIRGSNGEQNTGRLYSHGSGGSTDRALGSVNQDSVGAIFYGVRLINATTSTLGGFTVTYDGEQWRSTLNRPAQSLVPQYQVFEAEAGAINTVGTWTNLEEAIFTSPVVGGESSVFNIGNSLGSVPDLTQTVSGLAIAPGQEIWVRFFDANHSGLDHALGIDNFRFEGTAVPEASSLCLLLFTTGVFALVFLRNRPDPIYCRASTASSDSRASSSARSVVHSTR